MPNLCSRCGITELGPHCGGARKFYCGPCQTARFVDNGGTAAHQAVAAAVKRGDLPPIKSLACTDCGKPAHDYDHRDYSKPLDVQPVCRSCNRHRGPARPVLTFELPDMGQPAQSCLERAHPVSISPAGA